MFFLFTFLILFFIKFQVPTQQHEGCCLLSERDSEQHNLRSNLILQFTIANSNARSLNCV